MSENETAPTHIELPEGFLDELKANFNSTLYLLTEQMTVVIAIMQLLKDKGIINDEELNSVFSVTGDKDKLVDVYNTIFARFINYFGRVKETLEKGEMTPPVGATPFAENGPPAPPAENSAKEETTNEDQ